MALVSYHRSSALYSKCRYGCRGAHVRVRNEPNHSLGSFYLSDHWRCYCLLLFSAHSHAKR